MLHEENIHKNQSVLINKESVTPSTEDPIAMSAAYDSLVNSSQLGSVQVMLGTVIFTLVDNQGISRPRRAVLDSGSQLSFISQEYVK